jgi:hypothetical protein
MAVAHPERIARVVAIHRERRHQDRAVDTGRVEHRDRLVARRLFGPGEHGVPGSARVIALVGVQLGVDDGHERIPGSA